MEGSPVTAVSLGSTSGGGSPPSKAEEFRLALSSLGDGWLAGSEKQSDIPRHHGATVKISAQLSCQLQVRAVYTGRGSAASSPKAQLSRERIGQDGEC